MKYVPNVRGCEYISRTESIYISATTYASSLLNLKKGTTASILLVNPPLKKVLNLGLM